MPDPLAGVIGAVVKEFGQGVAGSAKKEATKAERVTSGSLAFDIGLGGGWVVGRAVCFWGDKGSGKSTTALRIVAEGQKLCRRCLRKISDIETVEVEDSPRCVAQAHCDCVGSGLVPMPDPPPREKGESAKDYAIRKNAWKDAIKENSYQEFICVWVDTEDNLEIKWAEQLDVDTRRLLYIRPATAEEATDITTALTASTFVDMMVVDSLAHFTPRQEYEESAEDWQRGLAARITNKAIRKWVVSSAKMKRAGLRGVTTIFINQTRMKIGVKQGDPSTKPSGLGQDFAARIEVRFRETKVEQIEEQWGNKEEKLKLPVKEEIRFDVIKNNTESTKRIWSSYIQALRNNSIHRKGQVIEDELMFKMALKYVIVRDSPKKGQYSLGSRVFDTQQAIKDALFAEPAVREAVRQVVIERVINGDYAVEL